MAINSPKGIWWNEPLSKAEVVWIAIAFLWGLVMFFTMIYWHFGGQQNLSNEAYKIRPELFSERTEAMVEKYTVREENGIPVVHPPAGSEVYLIARQFEWWPILELENGKQYRFHIGSTDVQHGFSLQPVNINLQIHPGYEMVLTAEPNKTGEFPIICNEYCGLGHHLMVGRVNVVEPQ